MEYKCPYCRQPDCPHWIGYTAEVKDGAPIALRPSAEASAIVDADDSCLFTDAGIRVYRRSSRSVGRVEKKRKAV